ncbi:unnamed protein product [Phaeothamnion confervicola]
MVVEQNVSLVVQLHPYATVTAETAAVTTAAAAAARSGTPAAARTSGGAGGGSETGGRGVAAVGAAVNKSGCEDRPEVFCRNLCIDWVGRIFSDEHHPLTTSFPAVTNLVTCPRRGGSSDGAGSFDVCSAAGGGRGSGAGKIGGVSLSSGDGGSGSGGGSGGGGGGGGGSSDSSSSDGSDHSGGSDSGGRRGTDATDPPPPPPLPPYIHYEYDVGVGRHVRHLWYRGWRDFEAPPKADRAALREVVAEVARVIAAGESKVLVVCLSGRGRSGTLVAAALGMLGRFRTTGQLVDAIVRLREVRDSMVETPGHLLFLLQFLGLPMIAGGRQDGEVAAGTAAGVAGAAAAAAGIAMAAVGLPSPPVQPGRSCGREEDSAGRDGGDDGGGKRRDGCGGERGGYGWRRALDAVAGGFVGAALVAAVNRFCRYGNHQRDGAGRTITHRNSWGVQGWSGTKDHNKSNKSL